MSKRLKSVLKVLLCIALLAVLMVIYVLILFAQNYLRFDEKFTSLVPDEWTSVIYGEMYVPDEKWKSVEFGEYSIELNAEEIQQLKDVLGNVHVSFLGRLKPEQIKSGEAVIGFVLNGHTVFVHYSTTLFFDGVGYNTDYSCIDELAEILMKACERRGFEYCGYIPYNY